MKYKNKLSEIETIYYDGSNKVEVENFINADCFEDNTSCSLKTIHWYDDETIFGASSYSAVAGDFIVKFPNGKIFTIWSEIFDEMFEPIKE